MADHKYEVLIVGGGTAGISVAARLVKMGRKVAIVDPAKKHYYQPLWTLVGGGIVKKESTERNEADVIPDGVVWIRERVKSFAPVENSVSTEEGNEFSYDYLIVAAGIQIDWDKVKGLPEAIGKDGVCSNYEYKYVDKTWEFLRSFKGGRALFTQPSTPIKCGGAPQKICYLSEDYLRKNGLRDRSEVVFLSAGASIFGIKHYAPTLEKHCEDKKIETRFHQDLVEIRPDVKEAIFKNTKTGELSVEKYDMIHVTPPMSAPDFLKNSDLGNEQGWVDVDKDTLQHTRYENIFAIGDSSSLPTSKTGAAIRKQVPVLLENLMHQMNGRPLTAKYDGYTSCPVITGYDSLVMAEFDYDGNPKETFPIDQRKERYSMYLVKRYLLPKLYWHGMLKGRA